MSADDGKPWVDLRHSGTKVTVLIENPPPSRVRPGGMVQEYVAADLDLPTAQHLRDDLIRRVGEVERSMGIPAPVDYGVLEQEYREHIAIESAWLRKKNAEQRELERKTLRMRAQLEPYWAAKNVGA